METGRLLEAVYPSISITPLGHRLGLLYESLPYVTPRLRLSHLLFTLPTAPIAIGLYLWLKARGVRYVATTAGISVENVITGRRLADIPWQDVAAIRIDAASYAPFYRSTDVVIETHTQAEALRLPGVPWAERFTHLLNSPHQAAFATRLAQNRISERSLARAALAAVPPQA
jgi:hypothetical protein